MKLQHVSHKETNCDTTAHMVPYFYEVSEPSDSIRDKELARHIQNRQEYALWFTQHAKSLECIYVDKNDPDLKAKEQRRGNRTNQNK
jgi:hypothetical protein